MEEYAGDNAGLAERIVDDVGAFRRALRAASGPALPGTPLTGAQAGLVRLVRRTPGVSVAAAAAELRLAANTVSTLVGQLTAAGVLVRTADLDDRRVARLELTEPAARQLRSWRDGRQQALVAALDRLPATRRRALTRALPALSELADLVGEEPA